MSIPSHPAAIGAVLFLGLLPTAVAYSSYFTGLHYAGPRAAIIAVLLEPLTATLLAALVNQEHLSGPQLLGALLILISTAIPQDSAA
ncbi:DMT family transporter [Streptomyces sp. NPDC052727]|uniref:DMT family transporter n=1 Tax=Streptomyces sp. NPDC052727 TaxID=3154854 RepID=UPI003429718E